MDLVVENVQPHLKVRLILLLFGSIDCLPCMLRKCPVLLRFPFAFSQEFLVDFEFYLLLGTPRELIVHSKQVILLMTLLFARLVLFARRLIAVLPQENRRKWIITRYSNYLLHIWIEFILQTLQLLLQLFLRLYILLLTELVVLCLIVGEHQPCPVLEIRRS